MDKKNFEQLIQGVKEMKAHMAGETVPNIRITEVVKKNIPHFNQGTAATAFIFSAPGTDEKEGGKPVAGKTGENLSHALKILTATNARVFPSADRYDYRITNAFAKPLSEKLGSNRTEASAKEIKDNANIKRVIKEVEGCSHIILCGKKAQMLGAVLKKEQIKAILICVPHTSNRGLCHRNSGLNDGTLNAARSAWMGIRIKNWTSVLLQQLPTSTP
jgi:uracil-DNA glycosylase